MSLNQPLLDAYNKVFNQFLTTMYNPENPPAITVQQLESLIAHVGLKPKRADLYKKYGAGTLGAAPACSIEDFPTLVDLVIGHNNNVISNNGLPARNKVFFRKENAEKEFEGDTITWCIVRSIPGQMSKGPTGHAGAVRERGPHLRAMYDDPHHLGHSIYEFGTARDNWIEFYANSKDSGKATMLAKWFEDLIEEYKWFFVFNGVNMVLWEERKKERVEGSPGNYIYKIPISYFVRTEQISSKSTKNIDSLLLNLCINQGNNTNVI